MQGGQLHRPYKVREFAKLADVTVRTLHHYEAVGLLRPKRTAAGYRLYAVADLERLEQVVALKFLGLPLQQIRILLDREPLRLPEALQVQLAVLEEKRQLLDRAMGAIREAVTAAQAGKPVEVEVLKQIIGAINMQNNDDFRKKYFSKESWAKLTTLKKQSAPQARLRETHSWIALFCDVEAARGADPRGTKAQALVARWMRLVQISSQGDRGIQAGWSSAWSDREHWPARDQERIESFDLEKISQFIGSAAAWPMKKYYSDKAWAKLMELQKKPAQQKNRQAQVRIELYREIAGSLAEKPGSEKAQNLAARSMELLELESDSDPGIKTGAMKAMAARREWPDWLKQQVAARCQVSVKTFNDIARFLEKARRRRGGQRSMPAKHS